MESEELSTCPGCGNSFSCGRDKIEECWCSKLPNVLSPTGKSCYCTDCLQKIIKENNDDR